MSIALMNEVQALKERVDALESLVRTLVTEQSREIKQQPLGLPNKDARGKTI